MELYEEDEPVNVLQGGIIHTLDVVNASPTLAALAASAPVAVTVSPTAANKGRFTPLRLSKAFTFDRFIWFNAPTVSGNSDIGLYDSLGNLIVATGSKAVGTANFWRKEAITPITCQAGDYFIGISADNTTHQVYGVASPPSALWPLVPTFLQTSVFPLPATVTLSSASLTVLVAGLFEQEYPPP